MASVIAGLQPGERARQAAETTGPGRTLHGLGSGEHSYAAAGVSLATAGSVVDRLRAAVESTGATGFGAFAGLHPLDDRPPARGLDRRRRHEADPRARARAAPRLRRRPRRALHQRRRDVRRRPAHAARLRRCERDPSSKRSPSSSRARPRSAARPASRSSAARPPSCPGSTRRASSTSPARASASSTATTLIDGCGDRARRCRDRLRLGRHPRERLHARPPRARRRGLRRRRPARADPALPRRRARAARPRQGVRAHHRRRHPRQPRRVLPDGHARRPRLGLLGAPAGLRLARAPRRRRGAAARLQPRHRLVRRRRGAAAGRAPRSAGSRG